MDAFEAMTDAAPIRPADVSGGHHHPAQLTMRGEDILRDYLGACPTCLGWNDPTAEADERVAAPGRPVCPTCGLASVEWDLAAEAHGILDRWRRWEALDAAVFGEE
ncbi:hypothetical protein SAMN05421595_2325 [Austwickia chelonae]|nr:hypothetical protein [Austwickia chelonae]SEW34579.1 hypothetical protein SAMN05421595_2325 [Austwickia chelonae]